MRRALIFAVLALGLASCGSTAGREDAPVGTRHEAPRDVWVMPDTFANVSGVCIGNDLVIVTTRNAPPVVLPDNEECAK